MRFKFPLTLPAILAILMVSPACLIHLALADNNSAPVNLPYVAATGDGSGNQWMINDGGWLRENGPQPIYSQADMITINNANPSTSGAAQLDSKTGELTLALSADPCSITRHVLIDAADNWVRYIDVLRNTSTQPLSLTYGLQTSLNYGVQNATIVADPHHPDQIIGWVGFTGLGRSAVEMFGGKGAKLLPIIGYQPGNSQVSASLALTIPPGKQVAVMHLVLTSGSMEQGEQLLQDLKESKVLHTVPQDLRKIIVNFPGNPDDLVGIDILRGDAFDVVELPGGDLLQGTLQDKSFSLTTFYGRIDLPASQVISIINVGQTRPQQLVVTTDGQMFCGHLAKDSLTLEMSSGQVTQIPLAQISRAGYRKRPGEPDELTLTKPYVLARTGERLITALPSAPIGIDTRYGLLSLDPKVIASIVFQSDDTAVNLINLIDGSHFEGLVDSSQFALKLTIPGAPVTVKFPPGSLARLQFTPKIADTDDSTPVLTMSNEDALVGELTGQLHMDTSFDTLGVDAEEIRKITRESGPGGDLQVTLWDDTTLRGQFHEPIVTCKLLCGSVVQLPIPLITEYEQPLPRPAPAMVAKIRAAVADLSNDDYATRQNAQTHLIAMGPAIMGVLREVRSDQPPEAQDRIDAILATLLKNGAPASRPSDDSNATQPSPPDATQPIAPDNGAHS